MERAALGDDVAQRVDAAAGAGALLVLPRGEAVEPVGHDVGLLAGEVVLLVGVGGHVEEHHLGVEVVAVVERAHQQVVAPADGALRGPRRLRHHEVLAAAGAERGAAQAVGEPHGVPVA